jgi:hypothetical protein
MRTITYFINGQHVSCARAVSSPALLGHGEGGFLRPPLIDYAALLMKSGWEDSAFGGVNEHGEDNTHFFMRTKYATQRRRYDGARAPEFLLGQLWSPTLYC